MGYDRALRVLALATMALPLLLRSSHAASSNGEEARWLVNSSEWATLSWLEGGDNLRSLVMSIASSDEGRIFMYLMEDVTFKGSLTFSEAQIDPSQFFGSRCGPDGALDPQDPRCAKLTISGIVSPVEEDTKQLALDTLFAAHPQMAHWPSDHNFIPCEMSIHEEDGLWMIANFGGGGSMNADEYFEATPLHHAVKGFGGGGGGRDRDLSEDATGDASCYNPDSHACECLDAKCGDVNCQAAGGIWTTECDGDCKCEILEASANVNENDTASTHESGKEGHGHDHGHDHGDHHQDDQGDKDISFQMLPRPDFSNDKIGHARWMVSKSLWTSLSTISSKDDEQPFGNIRSVVDGMCLMSSSGLPVFYLPSPDPSAVDIKANKKVALSFTESALAEMVGSDGHPCGGKDAEDPTCAKLTLIGHAKPLEDEGQIERAKAAFEANHPRASWLAKGGAHTGGNYYTLHLLEIMFLENFGGFTKITPEEYLGWKPDSSKLPGELQCAGAHGGTHGELQQQQSVTSSASVSFSALLLIVLASFIGSFLGGVYSDRLKQVWHSRKNKGYSKANSVDSVETPLEMAPVVV